MSLFGFWYLYTKISTMEYSEKMEDILRNSRDEAIRLGNYFLCIDHFCLSLIRENQCLATDILTELNCDLSSLKISIEKDLFYLLLGFLIYAIGAFVMIIAYRYGSLSVLQPFLSLNYVLSIFLGYFILDEIITIYKIISFITSDLLSTIV